MMLMALLAVAVSANAATTVAEDEKKTDVVLRDGETNDVLMHLAVGVNAVMDAPDGYSFAPFKSWDVQWTVFSYEYTPKNASQTYSVGLGLNWSNFGLKDNGTAFFKGAGDVVGLAAFPANTEDRFSSIHRLSLNIPLLFTQNFGKHFSVTLGPVVNFNTGCWLHNNYSVGDNSTDITTKKMKQNPVTVDVMGVFDIYGVGLYCKYSPMNVFKKDRGPEFKSLTLGLYF